ncbi:hypothetical protein V5H98_15185 [Georgenia sp. M64]|uniref:hypothetical protein n=1 Tax=Georgenia sp. M64 TaxID=3120520 RepID=UPI0030E4E6E3
MTTPQTLSPRAAYARAKAAAHLALVEHLAAAVDAGHAVPCLHPDAGPLWTSDDPDDAAWAASACRRACDALDRCTSYATTYREDGGTWAGVPAALPSGPTSSRWTDDDGDQEQAS